MARKKGESPVKRISGKSEKLTVCLPPQLARRLRAFAAFHAVDLGDVVAEGLGPVLAGFSVSQRSAEGGTVTTVEAGPDPQAGQGGTLRFPAREAV